MSRWLKRLTSLATGKSNTPSSTPKPRQAKDPLDTIESLEPRLCLGSMHAGFSEWARDSHVPQETASEVRLHETRTAPEHSSTLHSSPDGPTQDTRHDTHDHRSMQNDQRTSKPVTPTRQSLLTPQIDTGVGGAMDSNAGRILGNLHLEQQHNSVHDANGTNRQAAPKPSRSGGAQESTAAENRRDPGLAEVNFEHQSSSTASASHLDLGSLGLELDDQGNAIGFANSEVALQSNYDAWWINADEAVVIGYDFRDMNGHSNEISAEQQQIAIESLEKWSEATGRKIVFQHDTTSHESRIINIGVGDLAAVGHVSGEGAVLGLGGGQVTTENEQFVANGIAWLDAAENWDHIVGNGNPDGTIDFSTVVAHEIGHTIGLSDQYGRDPTIMNTNYNGERDASTIQAAIDQGEYYRTTVDADQANEVELNAMTTGFPQLDQTEVQQLLERASVVSASNDAIIAVVDRNGRILGVRVEADALAAIPDNDTLVFAIDGAVAKARTAAMFSNGDPANGTLAPLTSRTVRFLSQSTITQREVESNPNVDNASLATALASTERGPGFVAPIGLGAHFPPGINFTPPVDLFGIEHTNRDTTLHPGADGIKGTADDITFAERFNIDPNFVPVGQNLTAPESFGHVQNSGLLPEAQSRGIATLPGGIPLFRDTNGDVAGDTLVGGIGVFFPGADGYATHEQGFIPGIGQTAEQRTNAARVLEAEYIAFVAAGGSITAQQQGITGAKFGTVNGVAGVTGLDLPFGRLDLVGIQLDVYGPMGSRLGLQMLLESGENLGNGAVSSGADQIVDGVTNDLYRDGESVPEGWLVTPHDAADGSITAAEVEQIINNGRTAAENVRAAVRLPLSNPTRMVLAVTDTTGEVLGLFRMKDATTFSIDVAVAKARNTAYYADPVDLQAVDQIVDRGTAFTNRTFRFLSQPRFPSGIDGETPAPFSTLHDGNINQLTGENNGAPAPVGAFVDAVQDATPSIYGYDSFFPNTNFRDPGDGVNPAGSADPYHTGHDTVANQNGVVFFPGSTPIYRDGQLIGGFGVSGDGVDQDDVVTYVGATGFLPEANGVQRADQTFVRDVRLPYQKFLRNPFGGLC